MPLSPASLSSAHPEDTTELGAGGPVAMPPPAMSNDPQGEGLGANGPQYSPLDTWAAAVREGVVGRAIANVGLAREAGVPLLHDFATGPQQEGRIPDEMMPYADKYAGLHTPEEIAYRTAQLRQELQDAEAIRSHKWGWAAGMLAGQTDPVALASMLVPMGAATRVAQAVRFGLVNAGVAGVDETLMHQIDPLATWSGSLENVGASAFLGGVLGGAVRPHVPPAEFQKLAQRLREDWGRPTVSPGDHAVVPGVDVNGDSAAAVAADLRAAVDRHEQGLRATVEAGAQIKPEEAQARSQAAQEALRAAPPELTPEARAQAVAGEAARLATPEAVRARLEAVHGERMPEVLNERAEATVAGQEAEGARARTAATSDLERAQGDLETHGQGQAAAAELANRGGKLEVAPGTGVPEGYHVTQGELTDELRAHFEGLRSELPAAEGTLRPGRGQPGEPVPGGSAGRAARGAEGAGGRRGEPLPVYRGSQSPLAEEHFKPESFGHATARPSSGLGVFFTSDRAEAAGYGAVTTHHLDLRNPLEIKAEDVPPFDSIAAATRWRDEQMAKGHDGLVIDSSHLGGPTWYVPFHFHQVLRPSAAQIGSRTVRMPPKVPGGRTSIVRTVSAAPGVEARVLRELNEAGRFDDKTRQAYAALVGNFYATQAQRAGMTPAELFERYPLHVALEGTEPQGSTQGVKEGRIPYTRDLFGYGLNPRTNGEAARAGARPESPAPQVSKAPGRTAAGGEARGADVRPPALVPEREIPGRYARRTEIFSEGQRRLGASRIRTPEEAAQAFAPLARGTRERFDVIVTDKGGKPLAIVGSTIGTKDASAVYVEQIAAEALRVKGAAHLWIGHNHPSGVSDLSSADELIMRRIHEAFRGTSIESHGIVAIGGAERETARAWSYADAHGNERNGTTAAEHEETGVPVLERRYTQHETLGPPMLDPTGAMEGARKISGGESGVILLDTRHAPVAWLPLPQIPSAGKLRNTGGMDALHRALSMSNAAAAIMVHGEGGDRAHLENIGGFLRSTGIRPLDMLNVTDGTSASALNESFAPDRFFQQGRGIYRPEARTIALLEQADQSTFLHEAGHHFLDLHMALAAHADAPLDMREDAGALLKWFGVKSLEDWHGMTADEQRPFHEQFATTFERYLREGVAPSSRLGAIFARFRDWLTQLYRSSGRFGADLTPQVRGAMERMLATSDELAAARQARVDAAQGPLMKRVAGDEALRTTLREMGEREGGWAVEGGHILRTGGDEGAVIGRTSWVPNHEWWPGRPGGYSADEVESIVGKALAGEKLGPKQRQLIEYMAEVADQRTASEPYLPRPEDFEGLDEHLHHGNASDGYETAMVTRAALLDEEGVETLARRFEDDHPSFMAGIKRMLDAHDQDASLARRFTPERDTPGEPTHGASAGGAPLEAGGRGRPGEAGGVREPRAPGGAGEPGQRAPGGPEPATARRGVGQGDLFGGAPEGRQALADEIARRDRLRNTGQESVETGDAGDLFSQARAQRDIADVREPSVAELLARLPEGQRAAFEKRLKALGTPPDAAAGGSPYGPIVSAPGDSTAGAMQAAAQVTLHDLTIARGGRAIGKALGWFAPGMRMLRSPSLEVRKASIAMLETPEMLEMNVPSAEHPNGLPTPRAVETILKRWEGTWAVGYKARDALFRAYQGRELEPGEQARMSRREFDEGVSYAMRRGDRHPVPEVQQSAQATRQIVFNPLKELAQRMGLLPAQEDMLRGTAESYLMRAYDRSKIRADRAGFHTLLRDSFIEQGVDQAEADDIAHAVTRNLLGSELGLLDTNDLAFRDIVPQSGRLMQRQLLLPDTKLEPYLNNDINHLSHAYLKTLAPQVEITRRFGDKDLKDVLDKVRDEYSVLMQRALAQGDNVTANQLSDRQRADLRDLEAQRDKLYGTFGTPGDPNGWIQRVSRVIRSVNVFRFLGSATWSHVPDAANVIMRAGAGNTFAAAAKLASSIEALKLNRDELQRFGGMLDLIHNSTAAQLGEFGAHSDYAVQKFLNRGTRAFTIATLEVPWIATIKALGGAVAHDQILEAAERLGAGGKLSNIEATRFNQQGLGEGMLKRIGEQFGQFGQSVNGLRFGMTDRWTDTAAREAIEAATLKHSEASTLTPGKGDTPLLWSSELGRALFQFKTFGAVAVRKVVVPLAQGIAHGDLRAAQGLAALIASGAITYLAKQTLSGQPIEKKPARFALEVLDKSNLLGWTGEYFYPMLWQLGAPNFSRWGDRQTWETLGGPTAGTAVDLFDLRIPAKILGQVNPDTGLKGFSRSDIHRLRRMMPANQLWYLRRGVNTLEGKIGDAMNLPPEPVRSSTE